MGEGGRRVGELEAILRRVHVILKRRLIALLRDFDITPSQFRVLIILKKNGEARMKDLVDKLHRKAPTTSGIVDRLVKKGLVDRLRSEKDRRVVKVQLTDDGETMIDAIRKRSLENLDRDLEHFTAGEVRELIRLLEKLCRAVESD